MPIGRIGRTARYFSRTPEWMTSRYRYGHFVSADDSSKGSCHQSVLSWQKDNQVTNLILTIYGQGLIFLSPVKTYRKLQYLMGWLPFHIAG